MRETNVLFDHDLLLMKQHNPQEWKQLATNLLITKKKIHLRTYQFVSLW